MKVEVHAESTLSVYSVMHTPTCQPCEISCNPSNNPWGRRRRVRGYRICSRLESW